VDEIDTEKLFETGMTAMLRSLDPYTEFEGRTEAVEMQESVSGKYGGVGLVIAGRNAKSPASQTPSSSTELLEEDDENDDVEINSILPADKQNEDGLGTILLNRADNDNLNMNMNNNNPLDPAGIKEEQSRRVKSQQQKDSQKEQRLAAGATKKGDVGITVVGAFEGYAFDAGMRVGDKIVAVGDYQLNPKSTVDGRCPNSRFKYAFMHAHRTSTSHLDEGGSLSSYLFDICIIYLFHSY
jgi:hypothetical protein